MLVFSGGYRDFRGPTLGGRDRLGSSVEKPLSTDMETGFLEPNATSRQPWFADGGVGLSLKSEMLVLGSPRLNCISTGCSPPRLDLLCRSWLSLVQY